MKRFTTGLIIAGSAALFSISCKKSDDEKQKTNAPAVSAGFKCKIDGADFTADSSRLNFYNGGFAVIAFKDGSTAFEFDLESPAVRTHNVPTGSEFATYVTSNGYFVSSSGEVVVNSMDSAAGKISGTFSFSGISTARETKNITDGTFSIQ
jgi:hypothetical protein